MKIPGVRQDVSKGSRLWTVQVAELASWGAIAVVFLLLGLADLSPAEARTSLVLTAGLCLWTAVFYKILLPRYPDRAWMEWLGPAAGFLFTAGIYAVVRGNVPSSQLIFVPVIAIAALVGGLNAGVVTAALGTAVYLSVAALTGASVGVLAAAVNAGVFLLSGSVAGLLATELRSHYRGEQEEHRLATAVRHRLLAVLDAVDEAIVFRDRQGLVRVVNRSAAQLFGIDGDDNLGLPVTELLRTIARLTEDPEGFMETFQTLRDDPDLEIRTSIEQLMPVRRRLRLYSGPARDDSGALIGRIDVYTDVSEAWRRTEEVERLYDQARETAESYQRSLLPDVVPSLPRLSLVAHYIPARGRRAVCGDFYDFVDLDDGRIAIVMGDVCGIGPAAANDAALSRYTLRSFLALHPEPELALQRLNTHLLFNLKSDRFVRVVMGMLDPERASLELVNAGHVPPVIYRSNEDRVEWLTEGGLALGVDGESEYKAARIELRPGDMLVFYTDGVTEGVRGGRVFGQAKLQDLVEQYGIGTPGELAQAIRRAVEAWAPSSELRDDIAMLVCQVAPDTSVGEPTRELLLPNEPIRIREVRSFVASYLADLRLPVEESQEIVIAVGEAASNACKYGRRAEGDSELRVRCTREGEDVVVQVADDGPGYDHSSLEPPGLPDRFAAGGRGSFLMRQFADDVVVESSAQGTTVTLRRTVPAAA